ncbi:MAG TPA: cellulase family glycosylhydrolase [bacterium]|nr:cellulase family glycosylhydrolase [bacterium]
MNASAIRPVGFNFGGWISQSTLEDAHVESFLGEKDFKLVAGWGFNSVRLPVDAAWLFEDQGRGAISPKRLAWLKRILGWSADAGLLTILDLHQVPWHSFGKPELENLWKSDGDLDLFCGALARIAGELKSVPGPLWFDLLNEPTALNPVDWRKPAKRAYEAVRAEDPNRVIVLESTRWGSVLTLEDLVGAVEGPNLVYSFHFYEPMCVTHQRAPWWKEGHPYQQSVIYPGRLPGVAETLAKDIPPETRKRLEFEGSIEWNRGALADFLKPVTRLAKRGLPLYCGEFGVFEQAPRESRLKWTADAVSLFKEIGVGWSYWNYKWLDFGIWPKQSGTTGPLDQEMLSILQKGI